MIKQLVVTLLVFLGVTIAQNLDLDFNCHTYIATNAVLDTSVSNSQSGGAAVYIHDGTLTGNVRSFEFLINGRFQINETVATLTGQLVPTGATTLEHGFYFVLSMTAAPDASGRNMLQAGVSVDLTSWAYWTISTPSYLVGFGNFASSPINVGQLINNLPFQVGIGANGKNLNLGASVSLDISVGPYHIAGDVNIDLRCDLEAHQSSSELPSSSSSEGGVVCPADVRDCADGSFVGRDQSNNCEFFECPSNPSSSSSSPSSEGQVCTLEVRECADGSSVGRDPANNCEFPECPTNPSSSSSSSSPASSSSSEPSTDNGCSISVSINAANRWIENGRTTSLIYVTMKNNGTRAIKDVALRLDTKGDDCSSFSPSCLRQYWSMSTSACASANDAVSCVFGLPDWLTLYGGLRVGAEHNWGFISFSSVNDLHWTATCYDL